MLKEPLPDIEALAGVLSELEEDEETKRLKLMEDGIGHEFARVFGTKKGQA